MMEDVHMKLNPGLPWQKLHSARSFVGQWIYLQRVENEFRNFIYLFIYVFIYLYKL